jgi:hypothetical protein
MPFRRLSDEQKEKIIKIYLSKKSSMNQIVYSGNHPIFRS